MPPKVRDAGRHIDQPASGEQVRQLPLVAEDFDDAGQGSHFLRSPAGVAAHDDNFRPGILPGELPDEFAAFRFALGGDAARVDDAQIDRFARLGLAISQPPQTFAHVLGLVLIDLATEGDCGERGHGKIERTDVSGGKKWALSALLVRLPPWPDRS